MKELSRVELGHALTQVVAQGDADKRSGKYDDDDELEVVQTHRNVAVTDRL